MKNRLTGGLLQLCFVRISIIMFVKIGIASFIVTTLFFVSAVSAEKFHYCAVDGRGHFKRASKYCPILNTADSKVNCVIGTDRLDCLRKISKQQADFAVFTSEDLITATNSALETLITNELRFTEDRYEYKVVAVLNKKSNIKSKHDLQDKRFCHPGYGYESEWTRILSNYLEASVVPQNCQPDLTLTENRIKSSSEFFSVACKSGPWVENATLDYELKNKYPNLCEACDNPSRCSKEDKYWGRRGSLFCLTDGAGDISWARWDDVQIHFGLVAGGPEASADDYNLLCPDGSIRALNTTNPCIWVVKPWSVVAAVRNKAEEVQKIISSLSHENITSWQSALLNLMESYHIKMEPLNPIEPIQTYLNKATGFLSANSFPGCHPPRSIRICTTSIVENAKCSWLREAMASYGIEPEVDCLKADNTTDCMDAVQKDFADVVVINPDSLNMAQTKYKLKILFYETVNEDAKYLTVAVTRSNTKFETIHDLKGARACFPSYDGIAWNSVANYLNEKRLLETCPIDEGVEGFFGKSCVPGFPKETSSLNVNCRNDTYVGDDGAIRCLIDGSGDVAFISKNSLKSFLADEKKNTAAMNITAFKTFCGDTASRDCLLSWAPAGYGMVRGNSSELRLKDFMDVFFALDENFGKHYKTFTSPFTLFGPFNGVGNLLFHDATMKIRTKPSLRNIETSAGEYHEIVGAIDCKSSGNNLWFSYVLIVFVSIVVCLKSL